MKNAMQRSFIAVSALVASALPMCGAAQTGRTSASGAESAAQGGDCARAVRIITVGGPHEDVAAAHAEVTACGSQAGPALASSLRRLKAGHDTSALLRVLESTSTVHDAALFSAGLTVAADRGATAEARAVAILATALSTHPGLGFNFAELMRQRGPAACPVLWSDHTVVAAGSSPLPVDAPARVIAAAQPLAAASEVPLVRNAAHCAALIASWPRARP